jgi:hypothetical protein
MLPDILALELSPERCRVFDFRESRCENCWRGQAADQESRRIMQKRGLSSNHLDSLAFERGHGFRRNSEIGDDCVYLAYRANKRWADVSKFAGIGHNDDLLGMLQHLSIDEGFVGLERSGTAFRVKTRDAEKDLIHIHVVEEFKSGVPRQRKGPRPWNYTTSQVCTNARLIAQFHADVQSIRDDLDLFSVSKRAPNVRGCCSCGEADGFVRLDEFGRRETNPPFFSGGTLLARKERTVITKRLVQERLHQSGAAVRSANQSSIFEAGQISSDAGGGRTGLGEYLVDGSGTNAQ